MALPRNFETAPGVWVHREGSSVAELVEEGIGRALRGDWLNGPLSQRTRAFQGLQLERCLLMAALGGTVEPNPAPGVDLLIDPSPLRGTPPERMRAIQALYRTAEIWGNEQEATSHIDTSSGLDDTGIVITWPIAAIVVVVIVAGAAAIAYIAHQGSQVVDRSLARSEESRRLAERDAEAMRAIREHTEKEAAAGKQLPLSEPERLRLEALLEQQKTIVGKREGNLSSGFPDAPSLFSGAAGVVLGVGLGIGAATLLSKG
jgi:hypothetical protein